MLFTSGVFILFLIPVFTVYWIIPNKFKWTILLISNIIFYMNWGAKFTLLVLAVTLLSYTFAILIDKVDARTKKACLILDIIICLAILFHFKYVNFMLKSVQTMVNIVDIDFSVRTLDIVLPVGISFYIFQSIGYVVDVYRGHAQAESHLGHFVTFNTFFPQILSGPIARTNSLLPQIKGTHIFNYEKATKGLKLFAWGFYKKVIISDMLALQVDRVFSDLTSYQGAPLALASIFYTIQIYCDFSGYSDMAVGVAKLLDIDLVQNFKSPYFSSTISEFWSRWHISLSTWFRDYVYIPLGGNRCSKGRTYGNLIATFLVSGLWHGANWTYVVWGGIHGILQVAERAIGVTKDKNTQHHGLIWWCRVLIVFSLCSLAWIPFRASSMQDAIYVYQNMFNGIGEFHKYIKYGYFELKHYVGELETLKIVLTTFILFLYDFISIDKDFFDFLKSKKRIIRWGIYVALGIIIVLLYPVKSAENFIYFQF